MKNQPFKEYKIPEAPPQNGNTPKIFALYKNILIYGLEIYCVHLEINGWTGAMVFLYHEAFQNLGRNTT